jgi:hypothetical protein
MSCHGACCRRNALQGPDDSNRFTGFDPSAVVACVALKKVGGLVTRYWILDRVCASCREWTQPVQGVPSIIIHTNIGYSEGYRAACICRCGVHVLTSQTRDMSGKESASVAWCTGGFGSTEAVQKLLCQCHLLLCYPCLVPLLWFASTDPVPHPCGCVGMEMHSSGVLVQRTRYMVKQLYTFSIMPGHVPVQHQWHVDVGLWC